MCGVSIFLDLTRMCGFVGGIWFSAGLFFFSNVSLNPSQRNMSNFIFYFQPSESYDIQILDPFVIHCHTMCQVIIFFYNSSFSLNVQIDVSGCDGFLSQLHL